MGGNGMATIIGAGKYVFGEDIPMGKYNLKVIRGNGRLSIQAEAATDSDDIDEDFIYLGDDNNYAKSYTGLSLPEGWYFSLDGNVEVEISKSKMLEIE